MTSSATSSNRYNKQGAGDNVNTWGTSGLNTNFDLIDASLDGWNELTVNGNVTLTSVNYSADQARIRAQHFTGAGGFTVTAPGVSKNYICANDCTANVAFSNGASSVTVYAGETVQIVTDGASSFKRVEPRYFGGPITVAGSVTVNADPTQPYQLSTKHYVDIQTLTATLVSFPARPGNKLKGLRVTNDESTVEWAFQGFGGQSAQTTNYTIANTDREKLIRGTGSFTLTLPNAATLDPTFGVYVRNEGTGAITVTAAAGTVDALSSYIMYPGECRLFTNDGANWQSVILCPFYKVWTTSDAGFVWPPGYKAFAGLGWGAGGSGGSGINGNLGGSGGGGAACTPYNLDASLVTAGATATITVAAQATASDGGNSSIASLVTFYGGGKGNNSGQGGAGGGILGAGVQSTPGAPAVSSGSDNPGFGGALGNNNAAGTNSVYGGGAGGGGNNNTGNGFAGGNSVYGGAGGGGGTGAGHTAGTPGTSVFGGNGGAGSVSGNGADGLAPGGGGGGGGSNGVAGTGGKGARGEVRMWGII